MIADISEVAKAYRRLSPLGKRLFRFEVRLEVKPRARKAKPRKSVVEATAHTWVPRRKVAQTTSAPESPAAAAE